MWDRGRKRGVKKQTRKLEGLLTLVFSQRAWELYEIKRDRNSETLKEVSI